MRHAGEIPAGGSGLALTENEQGDYSLMDTLPQEKYFADLDQAVAEATAKSEEALKAAQTEVTNLRQQLLDYRNHADAEAKMNERWRDAETKLVADLAAARERMRTAYQAHLTGKP